MEEIIKHGFLEEETVFIDGTHIKANANNHKYKKTQVEKAARYYETELRREISADREMYVAEVEPVYEYIDGKATAKVIGMLYNGSLWLRHTPIRIKVYNETLPTIPPDAFEKAEDCLIRAKITGFVGKFYTNHRGAIEFTANAIAIVPLVATVK